jgi:hypothetical protein
MYRTLGVETIPKQAIFLAGTDSVDTQTGHKRICCWMGRAGAARPFIQRPLLREAIISLRMGNLDLIDWRLVGFSALWITASRRPAMSSQPGLCPSRAR